MSMCEPENIWRNVAVMSLKPAFYLGLLAMPTLASHAASLRAPTAAWTVNFDDAQCLAFRDYGTPDAPVQLLLKAPAIGDVVQLVIIRKASSSGPTQLKGRFAIDGERPFDVSMLTFSDETSKFRLYSTIMPTAQFALVRAASEISIQTDGLDERFSLTQMAPLLRVLDQCVADLRRVYNVTDTLAGEKSPLPRRAKADLSRLISNQDYPAPALREEQSGTVKFVVLVDEKGRVADCMIAGTSGAAALDAQSCAILKTRARFEPARGSDGKPAKDAVQARIVWRIIE